MKRFIAISLFCAAMLAMVGCGTSKPSTSEEKKSAEATTEDISGDYEQDLDGDTGTPTPVDMESSEFVELGQYKDLTVDVEKAKVTDADVEEEINSYLEGYADYETIEDRDTVEKGDYVNLDYTCTIDGKENEDYSDTDLDVLAGDGEIDEYLGSGIEEGFDLESKVIGSKVGSTVTTEFTFPKDYDDSDVAGKDCTMEVSINSISKEVVPKLDDAFVKEYTESKTVEEYRKDVRKSLEEQAEEDANDRAREQVWTAIVDNATQKKEFTEDMIKQELNNVKIENQEVAEFYYGMSVEEFVKEVYGMEMEDYAKFSLKSQCVQDLILKAENIEITDADLEEEKKTIAKEAGLEEGEDITEIYSIDEIKQNLISRKLFEKLMSYNKVNVVEVDMSDTEADESEQEIVLE